MRLSVQKLNVIARNFIFYMNSPEKYPEGNQSARDILQKMEDMCEFVKPSLFDAPPPMAVVNMWGSLLMYESNVKHLDPTQVHELHKQHDKICQEVFLHLAKYPGRVSYNDMSSIRNKQTQNYEHSYDEYSRDANHWTRKPTQNHDYSYDINY